MTLVYNTERMNVNTKGVYCAETNLRKLVWIVLLLLLLLILTHLITEYILKISITRLKEEHIMVMRSQSIKKL